MYQPANRHAIQDVDSRTFKKLKADAFIVQKRKRDDKTEVVVKQRGLERRMQQAFADNKGGLAAMGIRR